VVKVYDVRAWGVRIIADVVPVTYPGATEWHMERGDAVHACAAMIAGGQDFLNDPQIDGQVDAIRKFYWEWNVRPICAEHRVGHRALQYAGTLDLLATVNRPAAKKDISIVIDWKGTLAGAEPIQCAGYGLALGKYAGVVPSHVMGVQLNGNGTYRCGPMVRFAEAANEWLAILTAYRVRRRLGIPETKKQNEGTEGNDGA
jgi:hypothetical protein